MNDNLYLGIDIGTYETKGVLVNIEGRIIAQSAKRHELIVPQKGWAEHRPIEDWWEDFIFICQDLLQKTSCNPNNIKAVTASGYRSSSLFRTSLNGVNSQFINFSLSLKSKILTLLIPSTRTLTVPSGNFKS